jgi:molybdopterin-guanine dinucleotide biosynthesis protein B
MRVIGIAGWSGAGKTTLIVKLIANLRGKDLRVSTLKHAHHAFDVDQPGKDSFLHRQAGASEVLIASKNRWALLHELKDAAEPRLAAHLQKLSSVDLVLIEGFKNEGHCKIEVHRAANGKPWLYKDDPTIVAVVSDTRDGAPENLPFMGLDDIAEIAGLVLRSAQPLEQTLERLASPRIL